MHYDSLPVDEQIRRPYQPPKWWGDFEEIPFDPSNDNVKRDKNISGIEAVYRCVSEAKSSLPCREIARLTGYHETIALKWIYQLMDEGKITYDEIKRRKFWRLLKAGEFPINRTSNQQGALRKRILRVLEQTPQQWMSPLDLRPLLGLNRTGTIIQSLHGLWRNDEVQRRRDPAIMTHPRQHPYQYRAIAK